MIKEYKKGKYVISTDKRKLNLKIIHGFLRNAYWSEGIKIERVRKAIRNSICFGVYEHGNQIGFARVITDYTNFGYLADVFILESYRGQGLAKWLMESVMNHPELKNIKVWMLATKDAHGLYSQFGFKPIDEPQKYMRRINPKFVKQNQ